ncbi:efflux RND transporter periplasmic adaptor subunit [Tsuneonella sp. CC-YZS046]|uniref:efflux RND transporter periplasmic adaptor subunit n=1 Tax=Tsuneonella sp. CC-YZS046 TaxID=3042152 RepID=UPI002D78A03E|nr:efflux RND transporter periplasmic adaptor subunit [Tsuneonella sp. CC-YZS046]WRO65908.1 efflux RND transporter periplasmic adaptor subunit [Tsuneonella sp. CC-YZS046]
MNYEAPIETDQGGKLSQGGYAAAGRRRRLLIAAGIALAVLIVAAFLLKGGGSGTEDSGTSELPVVSVVTATASSIDGNIEATGTLAARRELPVGSVGEGGRVVSVPVDAGQWVRQGQVLAVIDRSVQSQQIAAQAAQVDIARADAALAQANLDRGLKLTDRGFISKADVDRLRATRDAADARVKQAQAQLGELRALSARLNITAPDAGLLLTRNVEPGQVVGGGSGILFSIARGGELELLAGVSEEDLAKLSVGAAALVTPIGTEKSFAGQIWQLSPTIEQQTRQGTARIALSYAPELRPGGFASASIRSGTVIAPFLPESAIQSDEKGSFVLIVGKDDKVIRRPVKTGLVTENGIAIVQGLTGGERVVLRAGGFLSEGDRVKPRLVKSGGG